jgi:hypothetical protein
MNDYNLVLAAFIAAVENLEVDIAILREAQKRYEQAGLTAERHEKLLKEIIELLRSGNRFPD